MKIGLVDNLTHIAQNAYFERGSFVTKGISRMLMAPLLHLPKIKEQIPFLLKQKIKSYIDIDRPQRILNIGCSSGGTLYLHSIKESIVELSKKGWEVFGIEISKNAREILSDLESARQRARQFLRDSIIVSLDLGQLQSYGSKKILRGAKSRFVVPDKVS